jgi:hypothetical protein
MAAMSTADAAILDDAVLNGRVVYIAGASAVQKGFDAIMGTMFQGTPIRFKDTASANYEGVAGKLAAAAGTGTGNWPIGTNVAVLYRVKGGSAFGVFPVARNTAIEAMDFTSTACGATGSGTAAAPYICTLTTGTRTPDAGISDVAPALFTNPINTEGEIAAAALTPSELAVLTTTPLYGLAFGLPVTSTVPTTVKFNKSAISAIMSGGAYTWNMVDASLPADDILICRRTPGSGTQAVNNLYYGNYPCDTTTAFNAPLDRSVSAAWDPVARSFTVAAANTGGPIVIENAASGDVRKCLDAAAAGGTYSTSDRDGLPVTVTITGAHKAIGVLSMDSLANSVLTPVTPVVAGGSNALWQFRPLDGAGTYTWDNSALPPVATGTGKFPTLANYVDGTWDMQGLEAFNVPARTTGNKAAFLANLVKQAQSPTVLAGISSLKNVAAAIGGVNPAGTQVLRTAYVGNNQCAPLNRNY